jgi:predicted nucleic acid-binding Zn ribbon protein
MRSRRAPRGIADAIASLSDQLAPATLLGDVQRVWDAAAGPALAPRATPTAARDGVVTLTCESAVWAQELTLMGPALVERLNAALGDPRVTSVRCSAAPPGGWARGG